MATHTALKAVLGLIRAGDREMDTPVLFPLEAYPRGGVVGQIDRKTAGGKIRNANRSQVA